VKLVNILVLKVLWQSRIACRALLSLPHRKALSVKVTVSVLLVGQEPAASAQNAAREHTKTRLGLNHAHSVQMHQEIMHRRRQRSRMMFQIVSATQDIMTAELMEL
jgi:hypothetical protein